MIILHPDSHGLGCEHQICFKYKKKVKKIEFFVVQDAHMCDAHAKFSEVWTFKEPVAKKINFGCVRNF